MKKLLIIGGGHAHVEVLRRFGQRPERGIEITLVSPGRHTPYSGMLPGFVAGHYRFDDCHIDLEPLAQFANAGFVQNAVVAIDPAQRRVTLDNGAQLDYDIASIDVGSAPPAHAIEGVDKYAVAVRPVNRFLAAWDALVASVRAGVARSVAMVGGGAAGVEVLLAMQHRLAQLESRHDLRFALVSDTPELLAGHARGVGAALAQNLARKKIDVHRATRIVRIEANTMIADTGARVQADAIFVATGAAAPAWLADTGLALNDNKFININKYLQSTNHRDVFAAGDCATIAGEVYPKSGVYAVRQGPPLAENLRRALRGESLIKYTPQPRALALIGTGEQHAIASYGPLSFQGDWVWRWKNRIDRRYVAKYRPPWK